MLSQVSDYRRPFFPLIIQRLCGLGVGRGPSPKSSAQAPVLPLLRPGSYPLTRPPGTRSGLECPGVRQMSRQLRVECLQGGSRVTTTTLAGKIVQDLMGLQITVSFKAQEHLDGRTHGTCHGCVKIVTYWNSARLPIPEKADSTLKMTTSLADLYEVPKEFVMQHVQTDSSTAQTQGARAARKLKSQQGQQNKTSGKKHKPSRKRQRKS
ncbi:hypothetical protein E4U61_003724 [Claviceps capensis]|nr:hypothetical protein E4U61_003724 [Claviceps capensis]